MSDERMTPSVYQSWALTKNVKDYAPVTKRLQVTDDLINTLHAAMGVSGEAGELMDAVKKAVLYGKPLDTENVIEELGDLCWYMNLMMETVGTTWEEVMVRNYQKLEKRYPSGFTEKAAQERADKEPET